MGQKLSSGNTKSQSSPPSVSKSSSAPSVTAKPKSEKEPKDLKSLSSTSNSNSLRVDESKPKVNVINFCFIFLNRK
ncbi:hypothetical protein GCK72_002595 [Caenorhabditis remanei]|uniref:Uncharacterized protein n=1 Tax=Caenorhabditis remanei TaxID=31234 RepID=A0A6A5HXM9_CAERE|nr:hypothetical protein GCK72_002595 [Caenorhabditis remanei]KAF1770772.1 hypothetical protein GCK72_002595 [Caenorhabditis remanei]